MKNRLILGMGIVVAVVFGVLAAIWWKMQLEPNVNIYEPIGCMYSITITENTAVPDWITETHLKSQRIDQEKLIPYEPLGDMTLDGQPIAWQKANGNVVMDNKIFSDLQFIDVTGFAGDLTPTVIGQITETDLTDDEWRTVLEFLLKSHVIRTYVHLEADLCLDQESNEAESYLAHFTGVHRYCTSECYEKPFEFTLSVDKQSGNISIQ